MTVQSLPVKAVNDPNVLSGNYAEKQSSWFPVIAFLPGRFLFAPLAECIMGGIL